MKEFPRISIVTPSFNDAPYLERTILSVLEQNYPNLEYIIIDGGSTDGSVNIIKNYKEQLSYWVSEKDGGMYDAIQKGFERSTGEIMGWINSDDKHQPGSLFTIAQVFSDYSDVNWVQGSPTVIDETDRIFVHPHSYHVNKFFFYQKKHAKTGIFIQQESTFWRRSLWDKAGAHMSLQYKYAGDFDLWMRFFQHDEIHQLNAVLGSFRQTRGEQASKDHFDQYLQETFEILESYPLTSSERKTMRRLNQIERIVQSFKTVQNISLRKFNKPVHRRSFYFDSEAQMLKKHL